MQLTRTRGNRCDRHKLCWIDPDDRPVGCCIELSNSIGLAVSWSISMSMCMCVIGGSLDHHCVCVCVVEARTTLVPAYNRS